MPTISTSSGINAGRYVDLCSSLSAVVPLLVVLKDAVQYDSVQLGGKLSLTTRGLFDALKTQLNACLLDYLYIGKGDLPINDAAGPGVNSFGLYTNLACGCAFVNLPFFVAQCPVSIGKGITGGVSSYLATTWCDSLNSLLKHLSFLQTYVCIGY